jgi:hypothetical protein
VELRRACELFITSIQEITGQPFREEPWNNTTVIPITLKFNLRAALRSADLLAGHHRVQPFTTSAVEVDGVVISLGEYLAKVAHAKVRAQRAKELAAEARQLYLEFIIEYLCLEHPELGTEFKLLFEPPRQAMARSADPQFSTLDELMRLLRDWQRT